jgi:hypothetical protein
MGYYEFEACRVSGNGNAIFPDRIIIDDDEKVLVYRKSRVIGCKETKIQFGAIASVTCEKHLLFADIIIETRGGREIIARGFIRDDANTIKELLSF